MAHAGSNRRATLAPHDDDGNNYHYKYYKTVEEEEEEHAEAEVIFTGEACADNSSMGRGR